MIKESNSKEKKSKIAVKEPSQKRSRETVDAILDASSRLLLRESFFEITTEKIAKEAGVSIGSLYQFFGNKESVFQGLVKRKMEISKQVLIVKMNAIAEQPDDLRTESIIKALMEVFSTNIELRAKMAAIKYYVTDADYFTTMIKFYQELVIKHLPEVPGRNKEKMAYLLVTTCIGVFNTLATQNIHFTNDTELMTEVHQLMKRFIQN